jgi:hypothetical protein
MLEHRHQAGRYQEHHAPELHETLIRNFKKLCVLPLMLEHRHQAGRYQEHHAPELHETLRWNFKNIIFFSSCLCLSTATRLVATRNTMLQNFMKP